MVTKQEMQRLQERYWLKQLQLKDPNAKSLQGYTVKRVTKSPKKQLSLGDALKKQSLKFNKGFKSYGLK